MLHSKDRLDSIERRLARVEAALGLDSATPSPVAQPVPPTAPITIEPPPPPSPKPAILPVPSPAPTGTKSTPNIERVVGGRWYAVLGAIVVIIGVGLFVQLAVQQGWMQAIPATIKCLASAAFGFILLAAGEFLRRRINAWAAFGLNAAGLGSVYVAIAGAFLRYDLLSAPVALVLLLACAALGMAIGVRARLVGVSIVALFGGYTAPFLVIAPQSDPRALPALWLMLQAVGLFLSARQGGWFVATRWMTWAFTILLGFVWILAEGTDAPLLGFVFLIASWGLVHGELLWSSRRGTRPRSASTWLGVWCSFVTSAWAAFLATFLADGLSNLPDWIPAAGWTVAASGLSLALAGNLRLLRDLPRTQPQRLGAGLLVQAGALGIIALAIALSGSAEVIAWIALGIAGVAAGRWIGSPWIWAFGLLNLSIANARLLLYDAWTLMHADGVRFLGLHLSEWSLMVALAALGWFAAALLFAWERRLDDEDADVPFINDAPARRVLAPLAAGAAAILLLLAPASARTDAYAISAWSIMLALAAGVVPFPRLLPRVHACWLSAASIVLWLAFFVDLHGWDPRHHAPLLQPALGLALLASLTSVVVWKRVAPPRGAAAQALRLTPVGLALAAGVLLVATSFEAARVAEITFKDSTAHAAAVSIWWGVYAIALLVAGFWFRAAPARIVGLALLGVATLKAVAFDLVGVSLAARTLSVLGLGLLMLIVGVAYAKTSRALGGR